MHLSLHTLSLHIQATIRRFPLSSAMALLWTGLCINYAEWEYRFSYYESLPQLLDLIFVCMLGFALMIAITLCGERWKWTTMWHIAAAFLCTLFLGLYFWLIPDLFDGPKYHFIRYVLFFISACLAISVGPFLGRSYDKDFWSFNARLFRGAAISVIFAGTLYVGLFAAMASVAYLFEIRIHERYYLEVWFILAGIVATHIFLSRIPVTFSVKEHDQWYPTLTRVFAQYILLPLVGLYTFILAVYSSKILLTGVWPKGQVCYMVLGYAAAGIVADILLWPAREDTKFRWVRTVSTVYYALLALFCLLLFSAIWQRIDQYGLTENRYYVVLLGTWTLCISLYFVLRRAHAIKMIPITLFSVLLLSSFGPWGAFSVSKQHQYHRLESVLERYNLLENGVIMKRETDELTLEDRETISGVVDYLYLTHGAASLQPYFSFDLAQLYSSAAEEKYFYKGRFPGVLLKEAGLTHASEWRRSTSSVSETGDTYETFNFTLYTGAAANIDGYSYFVSEVTPGYTSNTETYYVGGQAYHLVDQLNDGGNMIVKSDSGTVATFRLREHFMKTLKPNYSQSNNNIPSPSMLLTDGPWALLLKHASYSLRNGNVQRIDITGFLLRK